MYLYVSCIIQWLLILVNFKLYLICNRKCDSYFKGGLGERRYKSKCPELSALFIALEAPPNFTIPMAFVTVSKL